MGTTTPYGDENAEEQAAKQESRLESYSDDELFENIADIINDNFVLEVKASRNLGD
jgi:hypothetical protein